MGGVYTGIGIGGDVDTGTDVGCGGVYTGIDVGGCVCNFSKHPFPTTQTYLSGKQFGFSILTFFPYEPDDCG
jgi:hypothetical protein